MSSFMSRSAFESFSQAGKRSRSRGLDKISLDNYLVITREPRFVLTLTFTSYANFGLFQFSSKINKDMMSKIWTNGDKLSD